MPEYVWIAGVLLGCVLTLGVVNALNAKAHELTARGNHLQMIVERVEADDAAAEADEDE